MPQPSTVFPRCARVEKDGAAAGKAYLAAVRMAAEIQIDAVARGAPSEFGAVGKQDGKAVEGDAVRSSGQIIAAETVGIVDARDPEPLPAAIQGDMFVHEDGEAHVLERAHECGEVVVAEDGGAIAVGWEALEEALHALKNVVEGAGEGVPVVAGEGAKIGLNGGEKFT